MKFSKRQREYIVKHLIKRFDRSQEDANRSIDLLEDVLNSKNEQLIYELQYKLFISENFEYGKKLSSFIFEIFSYLYDISKPEEKHLILNRAMYLFESLFIEKYLYDNRMDKQSDSALNVLKNVSEHLNTIIQTQEKMIGSLSHEMRTSLNSIIGYLTLLNDNITRNKLNEEEKNYLKNAINASNILQSLIKDILDVTKLNSGQMEVAKSWFLLDELMLECIEQINIDFNDKDGVEFRYKPLFIPYFVYGDKVHLMEILINFLTNAYKYTDKGYIEFSINYTKVYDSIRAVFSVSDTGSGMSENQKKYIFTAYNRYQKDKQGLGLGMHIAKRLADKIGATISIDSELDKGSTFYLDILFKEIKEYKPNFKNKRFFFLLKKSESKYTKTKLRYLKEYGAYIKVFRRDSNLISYLLENNNSLPDILSFHTTQEDIVKFDALVYYLKNNTKFSDTYFIAENIPKNTSLKHFDRIVKYDCSISTYEEILFKHENSVSEVNNSVKFNILVVDDIETNLDLFRLLVNKRYPLIDVDTAKGGYEALGMCKVKEYDIIFLDLKMPGLDGYDVIKRIKIRCPKHPPIYAFTADVYKDTFTKIKSAGFEGVLEKPVNMEKLSQILERYIK